MRRNTAPFRLTVVALASVLAGALLGAGVAWAHVDPVEKVDGWWAYYSDHGSSCWIWACEYTQHVVATAGNDFKEFDVSYVHYYDATADEDVRFGPQWIWDEQGEHSRATYSFLCVAIDGANTGADPDWYWGGHDPPNYGTAVEMYHWKDSWPCNDPDNAGTHSMALWVP